VINYKKKYKEYKKEKKIFEKKYKYEIEKEKEEEESRLRFLKTQQEIIRGPQKDWAFIITTTFGYVFGLTLIIITGKWLGPLEHFWLESIFNKVVELIYSASEAVGGIFLGIILLYCVISLLFAGGHFFGILYKYYERVYKK
jgi:hypothetical protein